MIPAVPSSWYLVAQSHEVAAGRLAAARIGATELVVYRGRNDGALHAMLAHCGHLGAHLKHGEVVGDSIRCALHHRVFGRDGECRGAPGARPGAELPGQRVLPALERYGGIWVYVGAQPPFEFPVPRLAAEHTRIATRAVGPRSFDVAWHALIANGCDIDHLQSVHHRRLRAPPAFERPAPHAMVVTYESSVIGRHLADRVMRRLSGDVIRARISCHGGSLMLVESEVGARRSFLLLSMNPAAGTTTIRGLAGVAGDGPAARLGARVAAWLFSRFLEKDVALLDGLRVHRPASIATLGDDFMRRVFDYFESLEAA